MEESPRAEQPRLLSRAPDQLAAAVHTLRFGSDAPDSTDVVDQGAGAHPSQASSMSQFWE